jgi:hypothetical protein
MNTQTLPVDIVLSNRHRLALEYKYKALCGDKDASNQQRITFLLLCDNYIAGNQKHKHQRIKTNVKVVRALRKNISKTLKE